MKPSFAPAIIWLIISTILLSLPGSAFPKHSWVDVIWLDKWVHIGLFGIMVVLWCWAYTLKNYPPRKARVVFLKISIIWLVYGIAMEFVQDNLIPNRGFDPGDILADAIGCLGGLFFSNQRFIKK